MLDVRPLGWFACCALLLAATGCGSCKTRGQEPIEFRDGASGERTNGTLWYETGAAFGEYLHFPPGRTYDLIHDLGVTPHSVLSWIAFKRVIDEADEEGNTGNYAESAGNQVVVECQDEERVRVRNDTCADTYLRVELEADPNQSQVDRPCR